MENQNLLEIEYLSKKYDETNIPLYLSYPTTSWWKSEADEASFIQSYHQEANPYLYFHFPYCKEACYYCCCYKEVTKEESKKELYLQYLKKEFQQKLSKLQIDRFPKVRRIHWGGGTPTYLSCSQIESFFKAVAPKIELVDSADSNISIEAYPDDEVLSEEKLRLLRSLGFNEISLGIQDFDDRIQQTIHRDCKPETARKIVSQAKELGFRVHIDLCYGLPFQGLHELESTIRQIATMAPDRVAIFPYVHYPVIFPLQKRIPAASLPNSFIKILLMMRAEELFTAYGYHKVGIDHFVKEDDPLYPAAGAQKIIKDFMGYSVDQRSCFIGFGNSAISFLGNHYYHNTVLLNDYYGQVDQGNLPLEKEMAHGLSPDDLIRSRVILKSILSDFVIDKKAINREYGIDFDQHFQTELALLQDYEKDGLIDSSAGNRISLTTTGKALARQIAYVFDSYYVK
jgi:oxygen-independent coproporphyrinogen-3 oxidase